RSTSRFWSGSPRSMWPRRRGWCVPGCRTRPGRGSGARWCGRCPRRPTRCWSWVSIWPPGGFSGSPWRRPATTGGSGYLLEVAGLEVQLVNAHDVKQAPGRPKTDKLDAVWLAKLTERGMLRPSFVPPAQIRALRDYTRLRTDLTRERTRYWQRLEKLLEDALIKVSSVASSLTTVSARDMIEALIAGERDPKVLAKLARGRM